MNVIAPVVLLKICLLFWNDPCKKLLSTNGHSHLYLKISFTASSEYLHILESKYFNILMSLDLFRLFLECNLRYFHHIGANFLWRKQRIKTQNLWSSYNQYGIQTTIRRMMVTHVMYKRANVIEGTFVDWVK